MVKNLFLIHIGPTFSKKGATGDSWQKRVRWDKIYS